MPSLGLILVVWGLVAPLGTYGFMSASAYFKQRAAVSSAVRQSQTAERQACNVKVDSIAKEINDDARKQIELARQASAAVVLAPSDDPGLRALCERSASCRDRATR